MAQSLGMPTQATADEAAPRVDTEKRTIREFVRLRRGALLAAGVCGALAAAAGLAPYYLAYRVIAELFKAGGAFNTTLIWTLALLALVAVVIKAVCNMLNERFAHIAAYDILYHIRIALAQKLGTLPLGYFNGRNVGDLKKVLHEDVEKMEEGFAHLIPSLISGIVTPLLVTLLFFITDWRMALATIITLPLILVVFSWMYRRASSRFAEYNEINVKMNAAVIQYVNGMKVIKAFTQTNVSFAKLRESIETMAEFYTSYMLLVSNPFALIQAMVRATLLTIVPIGAYLVLNGSLDLPTLALFLLLGIGFNQPLFQLFFIAGNAIWQVNEAGKRILAIFDTPSLSEPAQPQQPRDSSITFRNVSFSYTGNDRANGADSTAPTLQRSNAPTLNNVSFTIPQGSVTALVGPSGAGKTTIARLIPRFWDVGAGAVLLGGVNIKNIGSERLMEHIAFVFQDVFLFNDTVAANIRIGKPNASDDDIIAAAKLARCHEFISELPQGYQTNVGENGQLLSGGQRQRLSIARAILKDAPVVVLDEATAFVDPENESLIQEALAGLLQAGKTIVIVAHRLSTITGADQILVIDDGQVAAQGTHAELLQSSPLYQTLWSAHNAAQQWEFSNVGERANGERADAPTPPARAMAEVSAPLQNPYADMREHDSIVRMISTLSGPTLRPTLNRALVMKVLEGTCIGLPTFCGVFVLFELFKPQPNVTTILLLIAAMFVCYLGQWFFGAQSNHLLETMTTQTQKNLRVYLAEYLRRLPLGFFTRRDVGTIDALFTTNIAFFDLRTPISVMISAVVAPTLVFINLLLVDWRMALATGLGVPLAFILLRFAGQVYARVWRAQNAARTHANARIVEYIQGIGVIRAFNLGGARLGRFERAMDEYRVRSTRTMTELTPYGIAAGAALEVGLAALTPLGVLFILGGTLTTERFLLCMVMAAAFYAPLVLLFEMLAWQRQIENAVRNINQFLQAPLLPEATRPQEPHGFNIVFEDVSFSYLSNTEPASDTNTDALALNHSTAQPLQRSTTPTLNGVSFTILERSIIALVGPSGSGKTTITNLIARFWDVNSGRVTIGGVDVRDLPTDTLLGMITMVFQDVYLFNDTIFNNIKIGKPEATEEEIFAAARAARCHGFILELPDGYDTIVGEGGSTLSGGQKQRISIARAILKDAPIVLLDEATASIDPENERLIQEAFHALAVDKTLIIIAHRLNTIQNADQILVLEDGRIAQRGRHAELLAADGLYRRFWAEREKARGWKLASDQVGS